MPDHIHGIIITHNIDGSVILDKPAMRVPSNRPNGTRQGTLNAIVQNFKSISTRKANQLQRTAGAHLWQRNYYERIIRTERELHCTRQYIETNPLQSH